MLCSRINKKHFIKLNANILALGGRYRSTEAAVVSENDESAANGNGEVAYPEILCLSKKAEQERARIAWHEEVKKLNRYNRREID